MSSWHGRGWRPFSGWRVGLVQVALVAACAAPAGAYCFEEAGQLYRLAPSLLWAIANGESGFKPLAVNRNKNGSYDFGVMQINSFWYKTLGPQRWAALADPCVNVKTGAWILAQCVQRYGYGWEAVGCYNADSKEKREKYARKIFNILLKAGLYQ